MKKIDRTALWVILVISILLLVVIVFQTGFPIRITLLNPEENDGISPYASLSFKFSQAVDPEKVAESFTIKPDVPGQWVWADNQNAIWYASTPLHRGDTINFYFEDLPIGEKPTKTCRISALGKRQFDLQQWSIFPLMKYHSFGN